MTNNYGVFSFLELILWIWERKYKNIRKIHSLNQKDFSERLGVSQGTLSDLERGACSPSCETIAALSGAFECDLNWLFQESGDVKEDFPYIVKITSEEKLLLDLVRTLPLDERTELLEIGRLKSKKKKNPNSDK